MTWVDLAVLGVMVLSGILAFMRGFVREVLGIGAWIGAILIATKGLPAGRGVVAQWIKDPQIVTAVTFVALLLIALIVLSIIARAIARVIRGSALGGIDRTLGLVFGLARGAALVIIAYIMAGMAVSIDHWPEPVLEAMALQPTYEGAKWVRQNLLPEEYRPRLYAPPGRPASAEALLHAAPQGRATGK